MRHDKTGASQERQMLSRSDFLRLVGKVLPGLLVADLLAACSSEKEDRHLVQIINEQGESHFEPTTLRIRQGESVTWQNISIYSQSVTCDLQKGA